MNSVEQPEVIFETIPFLITLFSYGVATFCFFLLLQPIYYRIATTLKIQQEIREHTSDGRIAQVFRALHLKKSGTPTGGGVLIWGSVLIVTLFSRLLSFVGIIDKSLLQRGEVYLPLFSLIIMGIFGAIDDFWNARKIGKKRGIEVAPKMIFLIFFALLGALWFFFRLGYNEISIPGMGMLQIGWLAIPLYIFVIVATANAVNITDGLDGLAGGLLITSFTTFGALAFFRGHFFLAIFCGIIVSALFAFLWFNVPPAKFFMGDTGSLALGACLGVIALMIDAVAILPIVGIIFVLETLSVIIQITSKRLRNGKKIFLSTPVHHHFEAIGWTEPQIVMRFWIIGGAFAGIGLIIGLVGLTT
ncbi:phospho-N-acetylmuramoyl-pentapeptide-transferase [Candidatus Peregrinibacteria bacterium]|nr:MAG: phospho-N-acetylmuramoyl-pentapeptide-transferase [Candidatus Peregrinibacteria bacterium]